MKENLNIGLAILGSHDQTDNEIIEKCCYDDNTSNCNEYGGLYQWDELMQYDTLEGVRGICPDGWHVPSDTEWTTLVSYLGEADVAGGKLKEVDTIHWDPPNDGATNETGFTALPGVARGSYGTFSSLGQYGDFWASSQSSGGSKSWSQNLYYDFPIAYRFNYGNTVGFSVRCIKN